MIWKTYANPSDQKAIHKISLTALNYLNHLYQFKEPFSERKISE